MFTVPTVTVAVSGLVSSSAMLTVKTSASAFPPNEPINCSCSHNGEQCNYVDGGDKPTREFALASV